MAMAGRWSIDPSAIDDATVTATGIYGQASSVFDTSRNDNPA
ncbi:hypothetical protein FHU34_114399 [Micromonospora taraxaci]|uniref:Uncharacterized protein n=1 Tax=Micromonospora taraxaci TaxID=1316803 RepID=A0A561W597_9ACTN|nr:hypothetical protein FHU34_114399 [Micromonospora taraxaci]